MERLELFWYRKTEKNGSMEFIISAKGSIGKKFYGTKINPGKFTVKNDDLQSKSTLGIKNLGYSDTGTYYCMAGTSMKYTFGDGTILTVVDFLPTTAKPATKKPPCKCKKQKTAKTSPPGVSCSVVIWAPLAGLALMLLIGQYLLASHTYRVYRRTHVYFRKYSPK
ncbi:T-cell surface glycoprotein CD8 beta chain isoform X2 [Hyla sarda]|nr:T-cell surface glycoprotein CD8 beta chain isoform X2 [Hyla sarda]XP_056407531.1 T-cell surface glycoprotein CD8 beta chain isoform X2 [Hyla sarda]XP_056407532.1 T-cell surface glycoprotein CD8 beta chain isoform X2 [Hyla sarda]XP_056407533.1 T-cell surface glycoprotein CD8 beta chain isoform X2 [Hyla sarda]XP_056407534.1 T-cell surface glycoprotein CD8 beta chain isoform X2 [Hyla sarda]XP_056407535.1 T-cell surface glycoprotein CD8 beta chain isoform X2 [Hyla sarda]